jgi:hypothetical protein
MKKYNWPDRKNKLPGPRKSYSLATFLNLTVDVIAENISNFLMGKLLKHVHKEIVGGLFSVINGLYSACGNYSTSTI